MLHFDFERGPSHSLVLALLISVVSLCLIYFLSHSEIACDYIVTLHYSSLFIVGIYLARQKGRISTVYNCYSRHVKVAIAILSTTLYVYAGAVGSAMERRITRHDAAYSADLLTALGASGLIILSLNSGSCRRILLWHPVRELGEMSYSVYLLHFIVLLIFLHLLSGRVPLPVIFSLCFVVTIIVSWVFYRVVEKPSIRLGRRLSASLRPARSEDVAYERNNPTG